MNKKLIIALLFGLPITKLMGQEALTLAQCREMALKYNKEMAAAMQKTQQAYHMQKCLLSNFFPNFSLNGIGAYGTADGGLNIPGGKLPTFAPVSPQQPTILLPNGGFSYFPGVDLKYKMQWLYGGGIQVEQPIYMGGKIFTAYKMAQQSKLMAMMNENLTATEVILKTEQAYALVVKAEEMKKVAHTYNGLLVELLKNVEHAHQHGLKPKNDVLKVQVRLNESELSIRKAENALRLASMNLCHLIGRPLNSELHVSEELPIITNEIGVPHTDITQRPEYAILNHQVEIAKQEVKLNRSELLPKIGIRASYNYLHGLEVNNTPFFDKASFTALLNVSVPLFHFGERIHKVKAAKAKLEQVQLEQNNLNEQMMLELTQAANNLDEAKLESELAEHSLTQAEENMRISRKQYEVGLETLSDHLEAQVLWQKAYETKVDAHFQLYLNHLAYLKATGRLYHQTN